MSNSYTADELQKRWPAIKWREPLLVTWPSIQTLACRVCIANFGINRHSSWQWPTQTQADEHVKREHP